ncbi:MAG: class I SAM-dependent methyltransferase [Akkermansiaceae bacterium]|nr:class I SAM-dependent methyltransferase [Akkermansiaceae bacterium]MCP5551897.1 class I SAM-dependent methyltransferase [Akkermansiaceae bacterium]
MSAAANGGEAEERERFFEQWAIYRKVIESDFMVHRDVIGAFGAWLDEAGAASDGNGAWLDLGCGDAHVAAALLGAGRRVGRYVGVDSSEMALREARDSLPGTVPEIEWVRRDILEYLRECREPFDIVIAGYSLHHFQPREKRGIFREIRARLRSGGALLLYDIFCHPGRDRAHFVESYLEWMRRDWSGITEREHGLIDRHISARDFPETPENLVSMAAEAGFSGTELYGDPPAFHRAMVFRPT